VGQKSNARGVTGRRRDLPQGFRLSPSSWGLGWTSSVIRSSATASEQQGSSMGAAAGGLLARHHFVDPGRREGRSAVWGSGVVFQNSEPFTNIQRSIALFWVVDANVG